MLWENLERFNKVRNKINEEKRGFFFVCLFVLPEIKIIKMNQTEILELKNPINQINNATESISNKADQMRERTSDLENKNMKITEKRFGN